MSTGQDQQKGDEQGSKSDPDTMPSEYEPPFPQPDQARKEGFTQVPGELEKAHNTKPEAPM